MLLAPAVLVGAVGCAAPRPELRTVEGGARGIEVAGLSASQLTALSKVDWNPDRWNELLSLRVAESVDAPALAGTHRVDGPALRFEPRHSPVPGVRYRAVFDPSKLPVPLSDPPTNLEFALPKPHTDPTRVLAVYPSADVLPENQLKFYIVFSGSMARGDAYRHIHLLRADGSEVDLPFLELDEELWDPEFKRFTLFFDPGRIKRGLKPREEHGPALEEGKRYTLVIDAAWVDAAGHRLTGSYRKMFRVVAPDDTPPDPAKWKIISPRAGTRSPVIVIFPEPMDRAMLERVFEVRDAAGNKRAVSATVGAGETRVELTPMEEWIAGPYRLVTPAALEDRAGNSIGKPFEVDVFHPVRRSAGETFVERPFTIGR